MATDSAALTAPAHLQRAAEQAYEALAPFYDDFTAAYAHEKWLEGVEGLAHRWGVARGRVFDVGCGTGKSAAPLQARGWDVTACDISAGMVAKARKRLALGPERCFVADMRALPAGGPFDLVLCLDDAVNYLLGPEDLAAALQGVSRVLRPGGLLVFDVNTLTTYEEVFGGEFTRQGASARYLWRGVGETSVVADGLYMAEVQISREGEPDRFSVHVQRHHSRVAIERAARSAGLQLLEVLGQATGARFEPGGDEVTHPKLVYVLQATSQEGGAHMVVNP